jgi:hypothetical protein
MSKKIMLMSLLILCLSSFAGAGLLDDDPFLSDENGPVWARDWEVLTYEVSFFGLKAGYAEFSYRGEKEEGDRKLYHINAKLWTTGLVKIFKQITDEFDYFVDSESFLPYKVVVNQKESDRSVNKIVYYDQEKGILEHFDLQGEKIKEFVAVPRIFEPVTVAYFLRTRELLDEPANINVYGGRKVYTIDVKIIGSRKVKTDIGVFETLEIKPVVKRGGKVMEDRDVTAWLINDGTNIPLLVHAKIKIGTVTGELKKISRGRRDG